MKTQRLGKAALFFTAFFLAVGSVSFAAQTPAEKTKDVKDKVAEAAPEGAFLTIATLKSP
jgi:hypothetical protein